MAQQVSGQPRYKRILLKLSGEALMGSEDFGIDPKVLDRMALEVGQLVGIGVQVGLVIGGGNLFRGAALSAAGMDRVTGDHMGMLATVMNALAMRDALERSNIPALVMSAISMVGVTDHYDRRKAMRHLKSGEVVIFSAGTGNPFFTTDSAACLRAIEIDADVVLKATKVDGVYTADPFKDPNAEKFERLTERERDVLRLTAQGYSAPEIGEKLFISPKTVDTYKQRINEKLGLSHRADYVQLALRLGLLARD